MRNATTAMVFILAFAAMLGVAGDLEDKVAELQVGDTAPIFQAKDDRGKAFDSQLLLGEQNLVVYFYPAAMTGGCTAQACSFRDDKAAFDSLNTTVVGVSGDSVKNLTYFKKVNNLNFPLLADPAGSVARKFGVPLREGGSITKTVDGEEVTLDRGVTQSRWTFIIDKSGKLIYKDTEVNAQQDSDTVLAFLKSHAEKNSQ